MDGIPQLAAYREREGVTRKVLADRLGVSAVTLWRWESGERRIDVKKLPKVSKTTGIPAADLRPDLAGALEPT